MYRIIAIVIIPVLFILIIEMGLRILGYGTPTAAVIKYDWDGKTAYCDNYKFTWRFFPRPIAREFDPFIFLKDKPSKTYRIFVLGGSAAQGVPDGAFSFSRILGVMLKNAYPKANFEVVNMAITAVNSHVVLEIVKDCVNLKPDLLILYMGNNEVVGPYGAGTVFGRLSSNLSLIRTGIYLKTTRIGQLLGNLLKSSGSGKKSQGEWRGLEMFLKRQVRATDPELQFVYNHFQRNLEDIRDIAFEHKINLILSTVGCNLKDNPPFGSLHREDLTEKEKLEWNRYYHQGVSKEKGENYTEAINDYLKAAGIDDTYAEMHFRLGFCYWQLEDYEKANTCFIKAREWDTLRFRADERINQILRQIAGSNIHQGMKLVDSVKAFTQVSPHGIPGKELFYEHVHLKFKGNYILAKAVFKKVQEMLPQTITSGKTPITLLTQKECTKQLAYTGWDIYNLSYEMLNNYIKKPPYSNQLYHKKRLKDLELELKEMSSSISKDFLGRYAEEYQTAIERYPFDWRLHEKYAQLLYKALRNYPEAGEHYRKVKEYLPHSYYGYGGLGYVLQLEGNYKEAVKQHRKALRINPYIVGIHNNLAVTLQAIGQLEEAEKHFKQAIHLQPHYTAAYCNLALMKDKQGQTDEAVKICRNGLEMNPKAWALHFYLGLFLKNQKKWDEAINALQQALTIDPGSMRTRQLLNQVLREKTDL